MGVLEYWHSQYSIAPSIHYSCKIHHYFRGCKPLPPSHLPTFFLFRLPNSSHSHFALQNSHFRILTSLPANLLTFSSSHLLFFPTSEFKSFPLRTSKLPLPHSDFPLQKTSHFDSPELVEGRIPTSHFKTPTSAS